MFTLSVVSGLLLALVLTLGAVGVIRRDQQVMDLLTKIHSGSLSGAVIAVNTAATVGIIVGLAWAPVGIFTGPAVIAYMCVAVTMHLRADDRNLTPALIVMALSAVYTFGRAASG